MKIKDSIENAKYFAKKKANSNTTAKLLVSSIVAIVMFIPIYIGAFFWWLMGPVGFWQVLAMIVLWTFALGWLQLICLIGGIACIAAIILDEL